MKLPSALTPYLLYIKLAVVAGVLALAFKGGCSVQAGRDAEATGKLNTQIAELQGVMANKDTAIAARDEALKVVAKNLEDAQKAEREWKDRAGAAEMAASYAAEQLKRKDVDSQKRLDAARDKSPTCAALLAADIRKVCGL